MSDEEILDLFHRGLSCTQIALVAKRTPGYVHGLIVRTWRQDKEGVSRAQKKPEPVVHRKHVPPELARRILAAKGHMPVKAATIEFNVSDSTVRRIWSGESHKEVQ